jgi:hypothetical protein
MLYPIYLREISSSDKVVERSIENNMKVKEIVNKLTTLTDVQSPNFPSLIADLEKVQ